MAPLRSSSSVKDDSVEKRAAMSPEQLTLTAVGGQLHHPGKGIWVEHQEYPLQSSHSSKIPIGKSHITAFNGRNRARFLSSFLCPYSGYITEKGKEPKSRP